MSKEKRNTGIYERSSTPVELREFAETLAERKKEYFDVWKLLGSLEEAITSMEDTSSEVITIAESEHPWPPDRGDAKETVSDAVMVRALIKELKLRLEKVPEAREIAVISLHLGQISNRLAIRPFEDATRAGIKCINGASDGGVKKSEAEVANLCQMATKSISVLLGRANESVRICL